MSDTHADFGTRPFVAGSLTGLRAFRVTPAGHLTGVFVSSYRLTPGVNEAGCAAPRITQLMNAVSVAMRHGRSPAEHELLSLSCRCGFYAYFDGKNDHLYGDPFDNAPRVAAIVEGFGKCVVGERGFRAEKLRLVALVRPVPPKPSGRFRGRITRLLDAAALWLATHRKAHWLVLVAGGLAIATGLVALPLNAWVTISLGFPTGAVWGVALARFERRGKLLETEAILRRVLGARLLTDHQVDWPQLLSHYPDVPVYPTAEAAMKAHPLTVPAPGPAPGPKPFDVKVHFSLDPSRYQSAMQAAMAATAKRIAETADEAPKDPGAQA